MAKDPICGMFVEEKLLDIVKTEKSIIFAVTSA